MWYIIMFLLEINKKLNLKQLVYFDVNTLQFKSNVSIHQSSFTKVVLLCEFRFDFHLSSLLISI